MNRRFALMSVVVLAAGLTVAAQERQVGGVGLTLFVDSNYRGEVLTFRNDVPNLSSVNLFRLASSLQVGPGEQWEVCDQPNYGGACLVVSGSESDLRRRGWNDRIASARRVNGRGGRRGGGLFPQPGPERGLELYSNVRFYGDRRLYTSAVSNLDPLGFNDRAMSLTIPQGDVWEVCVDANFRGCRSVSGPVVDLTEIGLARRISSARPIRQSGGSGNGGGGDTGGDLRIVLYDGRNFTGASRTVDGASQVLLGFGNRAQSVRVYGGAWELCDGTQFSGRCITVANDVQDLGRLGFSNMAQSARPVAQPR